MQNQLKYFHKKVARHTSNLSTYLGQGILGCVVMWQGTNICCLHLHLVDRGSKVLPHVGILSHHCMASQPRRPQFESSSLWKE